MARDKIIQVNSLSYEYGSEEDGPKKRALDSLSFELNAGDFLAVIGSNGSGKSTLSKCLNALYIPTEGDVIINGLNTKDDANIWNIRSCCGMVFQNPDNQLVSSIVEDDIAFGPENLGLPPAEIRARVDSALKAVGMYEYKDRGPHLLSGGQKQRVAIAGVLAMEPEIIVLDESTAMLDPFGRKEIMDIVFKLHEEGKTIVLITHFMEEALQAEKVLLLDKGKLKAFGSVDEVFSKYKKEFSFAARLGEKLRQRNISVPEDIFRDEDLEKFLCSLK